MRQAEAVPISQSSPWHGPRQPGLAFLPLLDYVEQHEPPRIPQEKFGIAPRLSRRHLRADDLCR
jgi:hypothetical protein